MSRQKMYFKWEIPTSVVDIVKTICADYGRRERMIKHSAITGAVLDRYVELNSIIDKALEDVEVGIRRDLLEDIQKGRGYDFSAASPFLAKNTYYQRKRKLIHDIAEGLSLIP